MAYIPPHLRKKNVGADDAKQELPPGPTVRDGPNLRTDEISNYFWPVKGEDASMVTSLTDHGRSKTLHDSAENPGQLAYILLYGEANPRWESDNIIYTKSSLHLLPQERTKQSEGTMNITAPASATTQPIAVFKQKMTKHTNRSGGFKFEAWYTIDEVDFLEPSSPELICMLEQKWSRKDRNGEEYVEERRGTEWNRSLGYTWAVVKLKIDDTAIEENGEPKIERLPDKFTYGPRKDSTPKKSVNEQLAEMRLRDVKPKVEGEREAIADAAISTKS